MPDTFTSACPQTQPQTLPHLPAASLPHGSPCLLGPPPLSTPFSNLRAAVPPSGHIHGWQTSECPQPDTSPHYRGDVWEGCYATHTCRSMQAPFALNGMCGWHNISPTHLPGHGHLGGGSLPFKEVAPSLVDTSGHPPTAAVHAHPPTPTPHSPWLHAAWAHHGWQPFVAARPLRRWHCPPWLPLLPPPLLLAPHDAHVWIQTFNTCT